MCIRGRSRAVRCVWLQGLTFDSGGYNIKAGAGSMIEMMKFDMGGSGATLGAAKIVAALKPAGVQVRPHAPRRIGARVMCV